MSVVGSRFTVLLSKRVKHSVYFCTDDQKNNNTKHKNTTVGTIPKSNRKIIEKGKIVTRTHKYMTDHIPGLVQAPQ